MLFEQNIGEDLSIDETALSKGELYTIITNKKAHGGKGALVAIAAGTKAVDIIEVLTKAPQTLRNKVKEVTLDMSRTMEAIIRKSFPNASIVTDRFHVQQLITEAVQNIKIDLRREALKEESAAILKAKKEKKAYQPIVYENGDTKKQLLARSHYLLFKSEGNWTESQKARANILFKQFPSLQHAYHLSMMFRNWYETNHNTEEAKVSLQKWYDFSLNFIILNRLLSPLSPLKPTKTQSSIILTTGAPTPPPNPSTRNSKGFGLWSEGCAMLNSFCFG